MSIRWIKKVLLRVAPLILCLYPVQEKSAVITLPEVPAKNLVNAEIKRSATGSYYTTADVTYTRELDPFVIDMVLSMNYPSQSIRRDDTAHYKIKHAEYIAVKGKGELGGGCAGFISPRHSIDIETSPDLFLGKIDDLGSFTIEFRFLSQAMVDGGQIFSRVGYFSGSKRGIEILVRDKRVIVLMHNLFETPDGRRKSINLTGGKKLSAGEWHHFALSFNRQTGKLAKYTDGNEDQVLFATADGTSYSSVFSPSFGERLEGDTYRAVDEPLARIGGGFNGLIDEFRISYMPFAALTETKVTADRSYKRLGLDDRVPYNHEGVVTSSVLEFPSTGTKVTNFEWNENIAENTFIWMEFRISDHFFHENDSALRWYRIDNRQKNIYMTKDADGVYLRGKFYQWRAHLIPSPDGRRAPQMNSPRLSYRLDTPPSIPRFFEVAETGDGFIKLKWRRNTDADILGYRIYYGIVPGRYDGIIKTINGEIITNKNAGKDDYVEVTITNDVIEENRLKERNHLFTFPVLKNTVLYFLAVSAYDSYKPDTRYNHESEPSKPVTARPFEGSEIR
ncbi:MAG: LamG domain-containing protein [Leptospirales bacterium]|nr:LamG domain-containing protein [Leptospirales bacterium]